MTGTENPSELMAHLTTGAVVVYALEGLKASGWCTWITADSRRANRIVSGVAAALVAFGVSWTGDASQGWTIHIPALTVLLAGVWEWIKQYTLQQLLYDGVVQKAGKSAPQPTIIAVPSSLPGPVTLR